MDPSRTRSYSTNTDSSKKSSSGRHSNYSNDFRPSTAAKGTNSLKGTTLRNLKMAQDISAGSGRSASFPRQSIKRSSSLQSVQVEASNEAIWTVKISNDGCYLAAGRQDGAVLVWERITVDSPNDDGSSRSSAFSKNDQQKSELENTSGVDENHIFYQEPFRVYNGHKQAISDLSWSIGSFLISASLDHTVRLWHLSTGSCLCVFQHTDFVSCVQFHPFDDKYFVSGSFDGKIRVWDIHLKKMLYWNEVQKNTITAISFTRDGSTIIAGTLSGTCVFYEFSGLKYNTQITVATGKTGSSKSKDLKISGIERMPNSSSEEKVLITCEGKVRLLNVKDKSLVRTYKGMEPNIAKCFATFSSDGEFIICPSEDRYTIVWDTLPPDANQQYSGVLSSVIHRHVDSAKHSGMEKFLASEHPITCGIFIDLPPVESFDSPMDNFALVVANDQGNLFIWRNQ